MAQKRNSLPAIYRLQLQKNGGRRNSFNSTRSSVVVSRALDFSNYLTPSANDNFEVYCDWLKRARDEWGMKAAMIQGINPPSNYPKGQTARQCEGVLQVGGIVLIGYVYPFFDNGPGDISARLAQFDPFRYDLYDLFLDLEDVSSSSPLQRKIDITNSWLEEADAYINKLAGIYTGEGVWDEMGFPPTWSEWSNRDCWWASYNGREELVTPTRGAFTKSIIHQFRGSSSLFGFTGIDLNVIDDDYLESLMNVPIPQDYQDKFGCGANDWPCVAANLEGIIHELQAELEKTGTNQNADATVEQIQQVLKSHGY